MNQIVQSRKAIIITENKRLAMTIHGALGKSKIDIETSYLNLYSIPMIRKIIGKTGNTAFIRSELLTFVREAGVPFLIALDYTIDLGLDAALDPDRRKLLRTLLISYIILSRGRGFENLKGNFLLIGTSRQMGQISAIEGNPVSILNILTTRDAIVNSFINELRHNPMKFQSLFYFRGLNAELPAGDVVTAVHNCVRSIGDRMRLISQLESRQQPSERKTEDELAKIVYRLDDARVSVDGDICDIQQNDGYARLKENEFYILGRWAGRNITAVADKFKNSILRGVATARFGPDDAIVVHLEDGCTIDASTAASLAQVLLKDLISYRNIKIAVSDANRVILEKSSGYTMLKNYLRYNNAV